MKKIKHQLEFKAGGHLYDDLGWLLIEHEGRRYFYHLSNGSLVPAEMIVENNLQGTRFTRVHVHSEEHHAWIEKK